MTHCNGPMIAGAAFPESFYRVSELLSPAIPLSDQPTSIRSSSGASHGGDDANPILAGYHTTGLSGWGSCPRIATLWTYSVISHARNELPSVLARAGTGALNSPIAQRWRKLECPCPQEVVVGWDADLNGALWTTSRDPCRLGEFEAHLASELIAATDPQVHIQQLYDTLPTGEVLALVRREISATEFDLYACILGVRGDITGDHAVNAADLAWLLANWGGTFCGGDPRQVADLDWNMEVNGADLPLLLSWWTSGPIRLLLPADCAMTGGKSICTQLPDEVCPELGADLSMDTTDAEQCLRCAIGAFGFEHPDDFAAWLGATPSETTEIVCTCFHSIMREMMEEHEHE